MINGTKTRFLAHTGIANPGGLYFSRVSDRGTLQPYVETRSLRSLVSMTTAQTQLWVSAVLKPRGFIVHFVTLVFSNNHQAVTTIVSAAYYGLLCGQIGLEKLCTLLNLDIRIRVGHFIARQFVVGDSVISRNHQRMKPKSD